jgi:hypothetical protein
MTKTTLDWEKEFENIYCWKDSYCGIRVDGEGKRYFAWKREIKDFIRQTLTNEKLELIERIKREIVGKNEDRGSMVMEEEVWEVVADPNIDGRNRLRKELNQKLDEFKKEIKKKI